MNQEQFDALLAQTSGLIFQTESPFSNIKPTDFFCEGWLTSLVFNLVGTGMHLLPDQINDNATWGREMGMRSWISSPGGNRVGTTWADGVIGQIKIRPGTKRGLGIDQGAKQFIVVEAKLNSPLSARTSNQDNFDQAARNIICMAIELHEHKIPVDQFDSLAFYVASPSAHVEVHRPLVTVENVMRKFDYRLHFLLEDEKGGSEDFRDNTLHPMLEKISLECISWEDIVEKTIEQSPKDGDWLNAYYKTALSFA